jgi:hypothetical protein
MLNSALRTLLIFTLLTVGIGASGCKYYVSAKSPRPSTPPSPDRARVYFVKPDGADGGASTFLLKETKLIGYLENGKALYVELPPGEHFFMSVASNVDGVLADLAGGRTYYIQLVSSRGEDTALGGVTENMSLAPLVPGDEAWEQRHAWVEGADLVTLDKDRGAKWEARKAAQNYKWFEMFRNGKQQYALLKPQHGE